MGTELHLGLDYFQQWDCGRPCQPSSLRLPLENEAVTPHLAQCVYELASHLCTHDGAGYAPSLGQLRT